MQSAQKYLLVVLLIIASASYAQRGKDNAKTINTAGNIVNEYTTLTANATAGNTTISVTASGLNANARFTGTLGVGDLLMIIQMQGATINGSSTEFPAGSGTFYGIPNDATWGDVTSYNNCGLYEFVQVNTVPNSTTITIDCGLKNDYNSAGKVQVIRVPRYISLTINNPGTIIATAWTGSIGGIVAIEVDANTSINTVGGINVNAEGFRGGTLAASSNPNYGGGQMAMPNYKEGGDKGEGIAGYQADYVIFGGRYARGAAANGGGGGDCHNAAGGGGANAGNITGWNGMGNPDNSVAGWTLAWNLEGGTFSANTSSGGGRGGYSFANSNQDATAVAPANTSWVGDNRRNVGGLGGKPLDYSSGRLFLGGGGGAGDWDNNKGGAGAKGGGLVYLMNYGTISGTGSIIANGGNGGSSGIDGAGGAGSGGTVILNSVGVISGISIAVNGGAGGDQSISPGTESEGPGGGGGGGYVAISNGIIGMTANGGANGTTNSSALTEFPPNGATSGGVGLTNQPISNFTFSTNDRTICSGNSVTLTVPLSGTVPNGTVINWYSAIIGGTLVGTGNPFTTPVLSSTTTYYVGTCPGNYRLPITVNVNSTLIPTITGTTTICSGQSTTLTASGGGTYSWDNGATTTTITVSPSITTTYTLTANQGGCSGTASVQVTVGGGLSPTITGTTTICSGQSTTLTANGGGTYSWDNGATTTTITVSPSITTTYTLTANQGGCSGTASVQVTVAAGLSPTITGTTTICSGQSTTLTANGGGTYSWDNGATTTAITVSPSITTTYTLTANQGGCSGTASVQVTVGGGLSPTITGTTTICSGQSTTLTANGGGTYSWDNGATTTTITVSPSITTTYTLTANQGGCSGTASVQVTVGGGLSPTITGTTTICSGQSTTLTANGGGTYSWDNGATTTTITVSPSITTTYTLTANQGGCSGTASVQVTVAAGLSPTITGTTTICSGQSTTLTANGGGTYSWDNGATTTAITVSPSITTTYTLTANQGGCSGTASQQVIVNPNPVPIVSGTTTICSGNSTILTASGGGKYMWNTGATTTSITITPLSTSTFTVTVTNGTCSNSAIQIVTVTPPVIVNITGNNICSGNDVTLIANGGTSYSWNTGATSSILIVFPASSSSYSVTASVGACIGTASYLVTVDTVPVITASPDITITYGNNTTLNVTGGGTYNWIPPAGLSCTNCANPIAIPTQTTKYCVTVTNSGGCSAGRCVLVTVDLQCGEIFIPNAFSPNNDGENDLECVFGNCIQTMTFMIFDRWGEKVFETSDPKLCWDGKYKGVAMNTAVLVYYFNATLVTGEEIKRKGNISLIK